MRYIIGIDLGTTNSAVAYVDMEKNPFSIQQFSIPQLVSSGRIESLPTLPSFCYLISKEEWPQGALKLPWKEESSTFVGHFAKIHGARVPTRLIQSAKSWLCNIAADRKERILPIEAADSSQRLSPVEVSTKYLIHIKEAWNAIIAQGQVEAEFEEQEIILTVPASFDEVARILTVEAAHAAGIMHLTLLEEPQAAFYCWISQNESMLLKRTEKNSSMPKAGETLLVCDIGGGTTDFSLISVEEKDQELSFQRMAVGEHLLLGGDNMDAALTHYIEKKFVEQGHPALETTQWHQLFSEARSAKENLLQKSSSRHYTVFLQGVGSSVIKGSASATIQKEEVEQLLLKGFFKTYQLEEALQISSRRGIKTMGLPYEDEPAITKHLALFLKQACCLEKGVDYILFNGGALKPKLFQNAILECLHNWFPHKNPVILDSNSLDLAVSRGAAYFGKAKKGLGLCIRGGLPRAYYLQVDVKDQTRTESKALTILSRGSEEGTFYEPERIFLASPNTPMAFHLLTSHVRLKDRPGDLIEIDPKEMQKLNPLQTILRFGKRQFIQNQEQIPVKLHIQLTPLGILELSLQSQKSEHRWNLEFQVRAAEGQENKKVLNQTRMDETFEKEHLDEIKEMIEKLYRLEETGIKPENIIEKIEKKLNQERMAWPVSLLRGLADHLFTFFPYRKISMEHEARWWNLAGFFLRPGYGFPLDDFRIKEFWKIILNDLKQTKALDSQIQQWICYRRVAGGLNKGQQMQLASEILPSILNKKTNRIEIKKGENYIYSEKIRALGSFERLETVIKIRLGEALLHRIESKVAGSVEFWALGRIGSRQLFYGSIGQVVPKEICAKWVEKLIQIKEVDKDQLSFPLIQMGRRTDHRELNLPDSVIENILEWDLEGKLKDSIFQSHAITQLEQEQIFGDRLPTGLVLEL